MFVSTFLFYLQKAQMMFNARSNLVSHKKMHTVYKGT